jgi:MtrB/PioB family decaheme-associated outer membrane protein
MKRSSKQATFQRSLLSVALLAAFGVAQADEPTPVPQSAVSVGGAFVNGDPSDRALFGQYNGLRKDDAYFLLDFLYNNRDPATGVWYNVDARNLGLDSREIRARADRQGDWKLYGEWWELTRYYPRTINTGMKDAGSTTPTISTIVPGTGSNIDLKQERKRGTVAGEKWFGPTMMVEASFTTEDKDGARIFGRGFTCPSGAAPSPTCTTLASGTNQWAILLVPESIHYTTQQIEAKFNFIGTQGTFTAGYYGTFFKNDNGSLNPTVTGNLLDPLGKPMGVSPGTVPLTDGLRGILQQPMALPPDNQAHQFSAAGTYAFSNTTRGNFKYSYTQLKQNEDFLADGLTGAPAGRSNLGAEVNTQLFQAGLTSRPWAKTTFLANVRYEDRKDKTPIAYYNVEGVNTFTNGDTGFKKFGAKLEGSYLFPENVRGTLGLDWDEIERATFTPTDQVAGLTALREKNHEAGVRGELRRSLTDTVSGMIGYVHSERNGSSWLKPNSGALTGVVETSDAAIYNRTGIFPYTMTDRKRDKVKFLADWLPADKWSVQLSADWGKDKYSRPSEKGLDSQDLALLGLDVSYVMTDELKFTAYYSYSDQGLRVAHSTGYIADLKDENNTAGIGAVWRASPQLRMGLDLLYIRDKNKYEQILDASGSAANAAFLASAGGLPDVTYKDSRIKFYGAYAVQKNAEVRLDVIYDKQSLNEWTWANGSTPFVYSDGTTVSMKPDQTVTYIGVSYLYRF